MKFLSPLAALAGTLGSLADVPVLSYGPGRRHAPKRFGDVTIRAHRGLPPKPMTSDAVTVSDFTMPYMPGRKSNGRAAERYRAARRNEARAGRRWLCAA